MTTSVEGQGWINDLIVYPNPTQDYIRIHFGKNEGQEINTQLFSMGRKTYRTEKYSE